MTILEHRSAEAPLDTLLPLGVAINLQYFLKIKDTVGDKLDLLHLLVLFVEQLSTIEQLLTADRNTESGRDLLIA